MDLLQISLIACLFAAVSSANAQPCAQKIGRAPSYIACACNTTYCDQIPNVTTLKNGQFAVLETDEDGKRGELKLGNIGEKLTVKTGNEKIIIRLDPKTTYQEILGFGAAFTDSVGVNLRSLSNELQQSILEQYFGKNGIGYTLGRVPIASTDFSWGEYSYLDKEDDFDLRTFNLTKEDFDLKISFIKRAEQLLGRPLNLVASPWSAPAWMKTNGKMIHGGRLSGRCPGKYYETWGKYYIRFFEEYHKNGLDFWGLTTLNEPSSGRIPFYPWQSMYMSPEDLRSFINVYLGPNMKANQVTKDVKIMVNDDNVHNLPDYVQNVFDDSETAKYVDGIAIHWYHNDFSNLERLRETNKRWPNKFVLSTEACAGAELFDKGPVLGMWQRGVRYVRDIIDTLSRNAIGWIDWNLCLNMEGGPTFVDNRVDSPILVDAEKGEYYKQPMFYAMAHFSKFVTPGSHRTHHDVAGLPEKSKLGSIAFTTPEGKRVLVLNNENDFKAFDIQIKDPAGSESIYYTIERNSFVTIVWNKH
ncbi:unnamed protein product [Bursaphelenchus xylophilus]|uniref:Glucosylceramidase n=1 Tax=Bursaphelenchus xylophilus TaxID=6326 RepID=A0A1I7RIX0_BURXY|nr:unnamed protein product [Bursaphelenchus xylophilus]CAG9119148.1 unnamed protein product [Bursaphelenchus xylophilus]